MKRKFQVALLKEWGLPYGIVEPGSILQDEAIDSGRWSEFHHLVFRAPDDQCLWRVGYEVGLTELQDQRPWDSEDTHVDLDGTVEGVRVKVKRVTTITYVPKEF